VYTAGMYGCATELVYIGGTYKRVIYRDIQGRERHTRVYQGGYIPVIRVLGG